MPPSNDIADSNLRESHSAKFLACSLTPESQWGDRFRFQNVTCGFSSQAYPTHPLQHGQRSGFAALLCFLGSLKSPLGFLV